MNLLSNPVLSAYGSIDRIKKEQLISKGDKLLNQKTGNVIQITDISISIHDGKINFIVTDERNVVKELIFSSTSELVKWLVPYRKTS